jgi:hypothetical protein
VVTLRYEGNDVVATRVDGGWRIEHLGRAIKPYLDYGPMEVKAACITEPEDSWYSF